MYEPVLQANPDINFCASELHLGHVASLSASLKGRLNSNSVPHFVQRYSYIGMLSSPNPLAGLLFAFSLTFPLLLLLLWFLHLFSFMFPLSKSASV